MAKRIFEIEWDENLGPMWMNEDNLRSCISGDTHVGHNLNVKVRDITNERQGFVMELGVLKRQIERLEKGDA